MKIKTAVSEKILLIILILLGICTSLSIDLHLASLPKIMKFFKTDKVHMQQSVTLFVLGLGLSLLFYGPLSDKVGRRPVVMLGLGIAAIGSLSILWAPTINIFLLCRIIQGIGAGVCIGLGRTMLADLWQGYQLTVKSAYFAMTLSLSPLLAPALGGYIQHWSGWQGNFIFLALFFILNLIFFGFFFPETNKYINPNAFSLEQIIKNYKRLIFKKLFIGCTCLAGLIMAANLSFATKSAFIIQKEYGIQPVMYGWLMSLTAIGGLISRALGPFCVKKMGHRLILLYSVTLLFGVGLSILCLFLVNLLNLTWLIILVGCVVFVQGLLMPLLLLLALSPFNRKRGAASALYGSFQMLLGFLGSAIVGSAHGNGEMILAVAYLIFGLLGILIAWFIVVPNLLNTDQKIM